MQWCLRLHIKIQTETLCLNDWYTKGCGILVLCLPLCFWFMIISFWNTYFSTILWAIFSSYWMHIEWFIIFIMLRESTFSFKTYSSTPTSHKIYIYNFCNVHAGVWTVNPAWIRGCAVQSSVMLDEVNRL